MSALLGWLSAGVLWGTGFFLVTWLLSSTLLKRAHPAARAVLFVFVLLKFAVPFGPSLGGALSALATGEGSPGARISPGSRSLLSEALEPAVGADAPPLPPPLDTGLCVAWALGVLLISAVRLAKHRDLRRLLAEQGEAPAELVSRVRAASERIGAPMPRVAQGPLGPCVVGVVRPVLVLPAQVRAADLEAMLVHELMHLRRRDPLTRFFQSVIETLFFFWPIVRIASRWLSLACEQACDLAVVETRVMTSTRYAELLLEVGLAPHLTLAMAAHPSHLERRIELLLMETKLRPQWGALVLVSLLGLAGGATAGPSTPGAAPAPTAGQTAKPAWRSPEKPPSLSVSGALDHAEGSLDGELIHQVVRKHLLEIRACYEAMLIEKPDAQGTLAWDWTINGDGTFRDGCIGQGTALVDGFGLKLGVPEAMGKCVSKQIARWVFPKPKGGVVNITYSFTLKPAPN